MLLVVLINMPRIIIIISIIIMVVAYERAMDHDFSAHDEVIAQFPILVSCLRDFFFGAGGINAPAE